MASELLHPMYFERTDAVDLDDVALRNGEMAHPFGHDNVRPRWHVLTRMLVKPRTHSHAENSREHRNVFVGIVPVRGKLCPRR